MTKILAVKYPSSTDRIRHSVDHLRQIFEVPDVNKIKDLFSSLLFDHNSLCRYNYCLIKFDNKLYIVEPVDYEKFIYSRKVVEYHPLQHLI